MLSKQNYLMKALVIGLMSLSTIVQGAVVTFHEAAPVPDQLDVFSLIGAAQDLDNVGTATVDGALNDATTYVAFDRAAQGQTFVTGNTESIYMCTGIWVQHAGYTENTNQTWYNVPANSQLGIRITDPTASGTDGFILASESYVITGSEPNILPGGPSAQGTGTWIHVALDEPIPLSPSTLYGFDITAIRGASNLFFEILGIKDTASGGNPYAAGTAYTSGGQGAAGNMLTNAPGDRVFVVELLAIPPAIASLPSPVDKATGVLWDAVLSWNGGLNATDSKIYIGASPDTLSLEATIPHTTDVERYSHTMTGLDMSRMYYWRVDQVQEDGSEIIGDVWSFTTGTTKATNPSPFDHQIAVFPDAELTWAPGINSTESTVYFGTNPDTLEEKTTIPHTLGTNQYSFSLTGLDNNKDYYWRVDENDDGTTVITGDVWHFRTVPIISITDPTLVGWWKFDEGASIAIDWSGLNQHGMIFGGAAFGDGFDLTALQFDASDDYVQLPIGSTLASLDSATMTAWINFTSDLANQRIFDFGVPTGPEAEDPNVTTYMYLSRLTTAGILRFAIATPDMAEQDVDSTIAVATGTWHHVGVTIDGETGAVRIYIDGEAAGTGSTQILPSALGDVDGNWLGKSKFWDPPDPLLGGTIDDFRIYNTALTQADIVKTMRGDLLIAWNPSLADNAITDVEKALPLSWSAGDTAAQHDVYVGTDENAVRFASPETVGIYQGRQSQTEFNIDPLARNTVYYWRIDEVDADGTVYEGRLWSFTVADYIIVDDMETYTDNRPNRIFETWRDKYPFTDAQGNTVAQGNGTGMTVGIDEAPYGPERTIVHSGIQSMPLTYDNTVAPYYSETDRMFDKAQDWTVRGGQPMDTLSLYVRGRWGSNNGFTLEDSTYTVVGSGADIWNTSDEFHYVYMPLNGNGSIMVRVDSIENVDVWAKAGVMIRDSLDPDSTNVTLDVTPNNLVEFITREFAGVASTSVVTEAGSITLPHWLRLRREGSILTGEHSTDGQNWVFVGDNSSILIAMSGEVYIGLAVTSRVNAGTTCEGVFSNVQVTGTASTTFTISEDIGLPINDTADLYIAIEDATGAIQAVYPHQDNPNAILIQDWVEWVIPLSAFANQGVDMTQIKKMIFGVGDKQPDGLGKLYIDDLRLNP